VAPASVPGMLSIMPSARVCNSKGRTLQRPVAHEDLLAGRGWWSRH
jgi:hypothetical protein